MSSSAETATEIRLFSAPGGYGAAREEPQLFAEDRAAFRSLR
jgi:hypothetical protein